MSSEFGPLVDVASVAALLARENGKRPLVVDCRFDLADPERGRREHEVGHLPGAVYAHLDEDLSAPRSADGSGGRHPLPSPQALAAALGALGVTEDRAVVAYDHGNGAVAARLWWLLRYLGHEAVAVLDGGFRAWQAAGGAVESGPVARRPGQFVGRPRAALVTDAAGAASAPLLVDSRDGARYRGDHEPLDPVAGHVPGAVNRFFGLNLDAQGRFLPAPDLRRAFEELLGDTGPESAVFYCGSGVTACHNLLAMDRAGLRMGRLYAGSWSDWCSDPARPVATGEAP